jgi:hypothetical protein
MAPGDLDRRDIPAHTPFEAPTERGGSARPPTPTVTHCSGVGCVVTARAGRAHSGQARGPDRAGLAIAKLRPAPAREAKRRMNTGQAGGSESSGKAEKLEAALSNQKDTGGGGGPFFSSKGWRRRPFSRQKGGGDQRPPASASSGPPAAGKSAPGPDESEQHNRQWRSARPGHIQAAAPAWPAQAPASATARRRANI